MAPQDRAHPAIPAAGDQTMKFIPAEQRVNLRISLLRILLLLLIFLLLLFLILILILILIQRPLAPPV